jgi:hypothetical protein
MNSMGVDKRACLSSLAKRRQSTRWDGYKSIADYHKGVYECDFVSPYAKSAGNINSSIMVILQDWSSDYSLSRPMIDEGARDLGYTPSEPTNRNLARLLKNTFGLSISDIYATNVFPFVKLGGMSDRIPFADLIRAARQFALPQIEIVNPRLVICLGMDTFNALRVACGYSRTPNMETAIKGHFAVGSSHIWYQAHTGHFGQISRNKGGADRVSRDWIRMKESMMRSE